MRHSTGMKMTCQPNKTCKILNVEWVAFLHMLEVVSSTIILE